VHDAGVDAYERYDAGPEDAGRFDAPTDTGVDAGPCVKGAAPAKNGCVTDKSGVFVSPKGTDATTSGTMAAPYKTISYAVKSGAPVIYVCGDAGSYKETVEVTSAVNLYGGMSCKSTPWTYDATAVPLIIGADPTLATGLYVESKDPVDVEDMSFRSLDATPDRTNSIAVAVETSSDAQLHRVTMTAGAALPGGAGAAGAPGPGTALDGQSATSAKGAAAPLCVTGSAGYGGDATPLGGDTGGDGTPVVPGGSGGDGIGGSYAGACRAGDNGASAPPAAGGQASEAGLSAGGGNGSPGGIGQGGGGGSGGPSSIGAGGGGSGGCGGQGGAGGGGGYGGGSSIAFVFASIYGGSATLDDCTLIALNAGNGGAGGNGGEGQAGGAPGSPSGAGCSGGFGGNGGQGGGGAGGTGGSSIGIYYVGNTPVRSGGTVTLGKPGAGGAAGAGGAPAAMPGLTGVSVELFEGS
jgi:hypothetical protein